MTMSEAKSVSLADLIFERLENDILSGIYAKGEILTELRLSSELNVSRTPIREAIKRLQQENLVVESGKGVEVIGIDMNDLSDIYEIRSKIEGIAAKRCAERISDEQLKELREVLDLQEFYTNKNSTDKIKNLDSSFHEMLYKCCGSSIYASVLTSLHKKVQKYRKLSVENVNRAEEAMNEHKEIYYALENHDGELAEKLTVKHVQNAWDSIINSTEKQ